MIICKCYRILRNLNRNIFINLFVILTTFAFSLMHQCRTLAISKITLFSHPLPWLHLQFSPKFLFWCHRLQCHRCHYHRHCFQKTDFQIWQSSQVLLVLVPEIGSVAPAIFLQYLSCWLEQSTENLVDHHPVHLHRFQYRPRYPQVVFR